jgi:hypothetical protein
MGTFLKDLRYATRMLAKQPALPVGGRRSAPVMSIRLLLYGRDKNDFKSSC